MHIGPICIGPRLCPSQPALETAQAPPTMSQGKYEAQNKKHLALQEKREALNKSILAHGDRLVHERLSVFDLDFQARYHEHGLDDFDLTELTRLNDRVRYLVKHKIVLPSPKPRPPDRCGKARYRQEAHAHTVANAVRKEGRGQMRVYACPRCGGWHLTHQPKLDAADDTAQ